MTNPILVKEAVERVIELAKSVEWANHFGAVPNPYVLQLEVAKAALLASLPTDDDDTVEMVAINQLCAKVEADAVAGLRYIEKHYGRLDGVGWDRVFDAHDELFRRSAAIHTLIGRDR